MMEENNSDSDDLLDHLSGHGDIKEIADISGYNVSYVRKVLTDSRKNELIRDIAEDLAVLRKQVRQKYAFQALHKSGSRKYSVSRKVENTLVDLHYLPARRLMLSALQRTGRLEGQVGTDSLFYLRQDLEQYRQYMTESVEWLQGQRLSVEAQLQTADLYHQVEMCLNLSRIFSKDHTIGSDVQPGLAHVHIDPFLTGLLLRSLLYQAVRITAPGGSIKFYLQPTAGPEVALAIEASPCLLSSHNLHLLNHTQTLLRSARHTESPDTTALTGHYIMHLQHGSLTFSMPRTRTGLFLLTFRTGSVA
ncbi:MAG: hypothetical protein WBH03_19725 [Cyclobacteriaceae bacterium]